MRTFFRSLCFKYFCQSAP